VDSLQDLLKDLLVLVQQSFRGQLHVLLHVLTSHLTLRATRAQLNILVVFRDSEGIVGCAERFIVELLGLIEDALQILRLELSRSLQIVKFVRFEAH